MYSVEGMTLVFSSGRRHTFKNFIGEVLEFHDAIIVRLNDEPELASNENVYGFDYEGRLLWQIPHRPRPSGHSPYVSIARSTQFLDAYNWDGSYMTLHPHRGNVLHEDIAIPGGVSSHRKASERRWI
jgi:hypothetical protein